MKKAFIIHGWDANPESDWYPWLKVELEKKGYEVLVPEMPHTEAPVIEAWVSHLQKVAGIPEQDTLFVGHSIGCQTIMRYFETLPPGTKVARTIFVAAWFDLVNLEDEETELLAKPWIETSIDFEKVKDVCSEIKVVLSSNDIFVPTETNKNIFEGSLRADVMVLENRGHFIKDDGILDIPELLEIIP